MKYLNVALSAELKTVVDSYSEASGIQKKKLVELALIDYINRHPVKRPTIDTQAVIQ